MHVAGGGANIAKQRYYKSFSQRTQKYQRGTQKVFDPRITRKIFFLIKKVILVMRDHKRNICVIIIGDHSDIFDCTGAIKE